MSIALKLILCLSPRSIFIATGTAQTFHFHFQTYSDLAFLGTGPLLTTGLVVAKSTSWRTSTSAPTIRWCSTPASRAPCRLHRVAYLARSNSRIARTRRMTTLGVPYMTRAQRASVTASTKLEEVSTSQSSRKRPLSASHADSDKASLTHTLLSIWFFPVCLYHLSRECFLMLFIAL